LTRGSPSTPNWRGSVYAATSARSLASSRLRCRATRRTWYSAAAGLMCGSRPDADDVTRSTGIGAVFVGSASRSAFTRAATWS